MLPEFATLPPLSLYIHLPWCVRKCPYCDFNSYEAGDVIPDLAYVEALLRDLDMEQPLAGERAGGAYGFSFVFSLMNLPACGCSPGV